MNFRNYLKLARVDKPVGILLLFLPCLFGVLISLQYPYNNVNITYYLLLFFFGSILMRSAGCVINDICDAKFDRQVSRTKDRQIANNVISQKSAIIFTIILLIPSLAILLQFNQKTIIAGFLSFLLVLAYPLMKRITYFPQIFLGLTFNIGALIAPIAILNKITAEMIFLYVSLVIWTIIYDSIYAFQDIEDDMKIGVKSTTLIFKGNPKNILKSLNFVMFLLLLLTGYSLSLEWEYYITILVADIYLNNLIIKCDYNDPKSCLQIFKKNIYFGLLLALAFLLG